MSFENINIEKVQRAIIRMSEFEEPQTEFEFSEKQLSYLYRNLDRSYSKIIDIEYATKVFETYFAQHGVDSYNANDAPQILSNSIGQQVDEKWAEKSKELYYYAFLRMKLCQEESKHISNILDKYNQIPPLFLELDRLEYDAIPCQSMQPIFEKTYPLLPYFFN